MATASMGTKLKKGTTAVAELTSIGGLELSADTIETTTLDSDGWRTFIQGLKDAGEVSISGYLNPTVGKGQDELFDSLDSGAVEDYSIEFPQELNAKWTFKAIVTGFSTGAEMEDGISFEASLKVSGKPNLGVLTV